MRGRDDKDKDDEINGLSVGAFVKDSVDIEPMALEQEYQRVPSDLAYWNERYARALKVHLTCKAGEKTYEAYLKIEHREALHAAREGEKSGSGRVTESMVEAAVLTDPRYQKFQDERVNAEVEKVRIAGILDALRAKKDMLVSLGAHVRQEMEGDPVVRAAHADAKRYRESQR